MTTHDESVLPLLDRLIDLEPKTNNESLANRFVTIENLNNIVINHIEKLLNSNKSFVSPLVHDYQEISKSLYNYGLMDLSSIDPENPIKIEALREDIEKTISIFEPRLKNVSVITIDHDSYMPSLIFRIEAVLKVELIEKPIIFNTFFEDNFWSVQTL